MESKDEILEKKTEPIGSPVIQEEEQKAIPLGYNTISPRFKLQTKKLPKVSRKFPSTFQNCLTNSLQNGRWPNRINETRSRKAKNGRK